MDCSLPGSSVHGILQARVLEWVVIAFSDYRFEVSPMTQKVKNLPEMRDLGLIPGLGRSPGEGHGTPLQYSCLEDPMDGGAW